MLIAAGVAVALIGGVMLANAPLQRRMIYAPDRSPAGPAAALIAHGHDVVLRTEDGLELDAWWVPPVGPDREAAVLVAPGNGGNRVGRASLGLALSRQGFAVLLIDYRGYGGNPGSPSERGLAKDARAAVRFLADQGYQPERTIYFGESLGTGVVAELSTTHPPAGMVLRSPFPTFADVVTHLIPWMPAHAILVDRYRTVDHLHDSPVPVMVLAGSHDELVPAELSRRVADQAATLHELIEVDGAMHNDEIWFGDWAAEQTARLADAVIG